MNVFEARRKWHRERGLDGRSCPTHAMCEAFNDGFAAGGGGPVSHVICFEGEGAEVITCTSWQECLDKFFGAMDGSGNPENLPQGERNSWLEQLADDANWSHDEAGYPYRFRSDIGEISKVSIYRVNSVVVPRATPASVEPPKDNLAAEWPFRREPMP